MRACASRASPTQPRRATKDEETFDASRPWVVQFVIRLSTAIGVERDQHCRDRSFVKQEIPGPRRAPDRRGGPRGHRPRPFRGKEDMAPKVTRAQTPARPEVGASVISARIRKHDLVRDPDLDRAVRLDMDAVALGVYCARSPSATLPRRALGAATGSPVRSP